MEQECKVCGEINEVDEGTIFYTCPKCLQNKVEPKPDESRLLTDAEIEVAGEFQFVPPDGGRYNVGALLRKGRGIAKAQLAKDEARIEALISICEALIREVEVHTTKRDLGMKELVARARNVIATYTSKEKEG